MGNQKTNTRSGVALIIVLGCIVMLSALAASTARSVAAASLAATQHGESLAMSHTLDTARSACAQWLIRHAPTAMLGADTPHSGILVLDERVQTHGITLRIQIHAFDQSTLIPMNRMPTITEQLTEWSDVGDFSHTDASPLHEVRLLEDAALESEQRRLFPRLNPADEHPDRPIPLLCVFQSPSLSRPPTQRTRTQVPLGINPRTVPDQVLTVLYPAEAEHIGQLLREWRARASSRAGSRAALPSIGFAESPHGPIRLINDSDRWAFVISSESRTARRSHWICFERRPGLGWVETLSHVIEEPMR